MQTKLDDICDLISECEINDTQAQKIYNLMKEYREKYHRSYASLMRIPGFRKLWQAVDEMVRFSARIDMEEE